jgi:hypothetical protein
MVWLSSTASPYLVYRVDFNANIGRSRAPQAQARVHTSLLIGLLLAFVKDRRIQGSTEDDGRFSRTVG